MACSATVMVLVSSAPGPRVSAPRYFNPYPPYGKPSAAPVRSKEDVYRVPTASLATRPSFPFVYKTNLSYCEHSSPKSASKFAHNPTYCRVIQGAGCNPSVHPLALVPLCRIRSAMSATKIDVHGLDDIVDAL